MVGELQADADGAAAAVITVDGATNGVQVLCATDKSRCILLRMRLSNCRLKVRCFLCRTAVARTTRLSVVSSSGV